MTGEKEQLQPIVNAFAAHLRKQGCRSVSKKMGGTECLYRADGGLSCGIGGLIKDEHYSASLETLSAWTPEVRAALAASGYPTNRIEMGRLRELQGCHDKANDENFIESFSAYLLEFCRRYGVDYPASA